MNKFKVMIADSTEAFCRELQENLRDNYLTKVCRDGISVQEALPLFCPDILVLDMLLPGIDGITLLQQAAELGLSPVVIATTGYCSSYIIDAAERMGISYLMRKPCSAEACAQRIADLALTLPTQPDRYIDPRTQVSNLLLQLGFSAKLKGYGFLREGILLFAQDPAQTVTKELYPTVAKLFHSTGDRVERGIRSAIHSAWDPDGQPLWRSLFSGSDPCLQCPTNSEFIACIADRLLLESERPVL